MQSLILTLHIIVCVLLVILILLQSGKEGMGVIFGGGNTSLFGSTGAGGILVKLTTFMALVFVVTSLSYTYVTSEHKEKESTILDVKIEDVSPKDSKTMDPSSKVTPTPEAPKAQDAVKENVIEKPSEEKVQGTEVKPDTKPEASQEKVKEDKAEAAKGDNSSQGNEVKEDKANGGKSAAAKSDVSQGQKGDKGKGNSADKDSNKGKEGKN